MLSSHENIVYSIYEIKGKQIHPRYAQNSIKSVIISLSVTNGCS